MGTADRIYELVKGLPEPEARRILRLIENIAEAGVTTIPAQRRINLGLFRQYRGRYDGVKIERDELYDRAGLR